MQHIIQNGFSILFKQLNINKHTLSVNIDTDLSTIELWISGVCKPQLQHLIKISKLYQVSTDFILYSELRPPLYIDHLNDKDKDIIFYITSRFKDQQYKFRDKKINKRPLNIHDKIKYLRTDVIKLSQNEFGNKLNVSRDTIKHWESGVSKPNTEQILIIALLCHVSTDYIIIDNCKEQINLYGITDEQYNLLKDLISIFSSNEK